MKHWVVLAGLAAATALTGSAHAQKADAWNGTWSGTTERGGTVQVVVSGNKAASYVFRGQPVNIVGSQVSGNRLTINVNGGIPGTVQLVKGQGATASYAYSDTSGGSAKATLTRR